MVLREPVCLGIQRDVQVIGLVPGDTPQAVFNFLVDVVSGSCVGLDFRGPFVHGEGQKRFLYLSWGQIGAYGSFMMFRRVKLLLSTIRSKDIIRSLSAAAPAIEGTIDLTDNKGGPVCGKVAAQKINWRVLGIRN
jgi:Family of unknown function (DUF5990)